MTGEEEAQAWTSPLFSVSEFSAVGKGKKIPLHFVFLMSLGFSPAGFYSLLLASQIRRMLAYFKFHRIRQPLINRKIDVLECYQNMEMESWSGLHPFSLWVQWSYITVGGQMRWGRESVCKSVCSFKQLVACLLYAKGVFCWHNIPLSAHWWTCKVHLLMTGEKAGSHWCLKAMGLPDR